MLGLGSTKAASLLPRFEKVVFQTSLRWTH